MSVTQAVPSRVPASLATPTGLEPQGRDRLVGLLNVLLADAVALYVKTKNFHWHMVGSHYRDYHLLLDEQADQIIAATDSFAERVRMIGGTTIRSIGHIGRLQRAIHAFITDCIERFGHEHHQYQ